MLQILDQIGDTNAVELHAYAKQYEVPAFVKQANMQETLRPSDLPDTVYADPRLHLFPCHKAAATWLSALYFNEKRAAYQSKDADRVQQRLDKAVTYWGIKAAVDALKARYDELHKNADDRLPDSDFAYVWQADNGVKHRHWRMKNAREVKAAAEALHANRNLPPSSPERMPYSDSNTVAGRILQKAANFGADLGKLSTWVEKQAGHGICDSKEVVKMISNRAKLAKTAEVRHQIEKLAAPVAGSPRHALEPSMLIKLASTMELTDRGLGIENYSDAIPRPEDVLFAYTYENMKEATENVVALTTGRLYPRDRFEKIALQDIQDLFGDDFAKAVGDGLYVDGVKLAEQVAAFPRPEAEQFEALLAEAGIPPLAQKSASERRGIKPQALEALAATY